MASKRETLPLSLKEREGKEDVSIHSIPCYIATNTTAGIMNTDNSVKEQFESLINHAPDHTHPIDKCSFRGRPLQGVKCPLPNDYMGLVIKGEESNDGGCGQFYVHDTFLSLHCWSLDTPPSCDEGIPATINTWTQLAKCIHEPVPSAQYNSTH